jgi:hypothetical protein
LYLRRIYLLFYTCMLTSTVLYLHVVSL